jgi:tetratricopeptide (TPR) repeat protein
VDFQRGKRYTFYIREELRMKRTASIIFVILIATIPLVAEDLLVEYVEGTLELKEDSHWVELYIGDLLPENSLIRLSNNGFAELSTRNVTVTLSEEGTYDTQNLLRSGQKVASWDIGGIVNSKLSKLISPAEQGETAVMGVRGAAADQEELTWVEEGGDYMERGKQLLVDGLFEEAIPVFKDGADWALTEDERSEYLFYAAYAHALKGDSALALIMLEDLALGSDSTVFTDYVLLKGKLLIENLAFNDALNLFSEYLRHPDMGETTQIVYFLSAVCQQGLDNTTQARKFLQDAVKIDATSEYGKAAQRMMGSL